MTLASNFYTIGHSTLPIELFIGHLKSYSVTRLYDVRTTPFSRYQPQFNMEALARALKASGIEYFFAGEALGGRSNRESDYINDQVVYSRMKENPKFIEALNQITSESAETNIALMCSEKDPLDCHRTLLISQALVEQDFAVKHILIDGSSESHEQSVQRLLKNSKLEHDDLFQDEVDRVREALEKQEKAIAYKRTNFLKAL